MADLTREDVLISANELAERLGHGWMPMVWKTDRWNFGAHIIVRGGGAKMEGGGEWKDAEYTITLSAGKHEVIIGSSDPTVLFDAAMKALEQKVKADYDTLNALKEFQGVAVDS